jgi:AraC-like DNA-binding protein
MHLMHGDMPPHFNPRQGRHIHAGPELLLVEDGHGQQLVRSAVVPCRAGDFFVFPAKTPHMSHTAAGESFTCLVMNCDPGDLPDGRTGDGGRELFDALAALVPDGGRLPIRPATSRQCAVLLRRAFEEWNNRRLGSACAARALSMEMLTLLARDVCGPGRDYTPADVAERHIELARRWLADYWMMPVRISDLVALGPLGRSQFLVRFHASTGLSVGDALLAIRLREAQRMLCEGRGTMLDVALACGFGSQSHFNHRFRTATGLTPREWLRRQAVN